MKKMIPVVAAVLAMGMVLSGPAYAAPKEAVKSEKVQKEKQKPQQNKGQIQQLSSINKKLNKIEAKIDHYQEKLKNLTTTNDDLEEQEDTEKPDENVLENEQSDTPDEPNNELGSETELDDLEDGAVNSAAKNVKKAPLNMPISDTDPDSIVGSEDDAIENDDDQTDGENNEEGEPESDEPGDDIGAADDTDVDDEADEDNEAVELEDEVNQFPGYAGKFHALQNRLNAVTFQVNKLESKGADSEQIQLLLERIQTLQDRITEALTMLNQVQDQVKEELSDDDSAQEMEPAEDVPVTKAWTINFSQKLDPKTLSNLDIVVLDKEQNLVETSISYTEETKSVKILPNQPYKTGESYTLYVGKKISGKSGKDLKNSVKMDFTVK